MFLNKNSRAIKEADKSITERRLDKWKNLSRRKQTKKRPVNIPLLKFLRKAVVKQVMLKKIRVKKKNSFGVVGELKLIRDTRINKKKTPNIKIDKRCFFRLTNLV